MLRTFAAAMLLLSAAGAAASDAPARLLTPAEAADFEATPSLDETLAFIRSLEPYLPEMRLTAFGTSAAGRPLPLVILSAERAFDPTRAAALAKPVVLIQSGIHPGEIDGKDAVLMLLRDLAQGKRRELLDAATILLVPIYNVDGHERVSPHNRPNQDGPHRGMGFRTNAAGLDLNRDHVKAAAVETRALLALFNRWRPDLHVDVHVTDGIDLDWVLTWSVAETPQLAAPVSAWVSSHLPRVLAATEAAGHRCGPYVDLLDRSDPSLGFSSWVGGPRFSTGYWPLRNRASILLEMHSYKPYRQRVLAVRDFLDALLREVGASGAALRGAVAAAERATVDAGRPGAPPSRVVLEWRASEQSETIELPVYAWHTEPSLVTGGELIRYDRGTVAPVTVPWRHRAEPAATASRPRGYLVLPGWPQIEDRLAAHGLRVEMLTEAAALPVESLWVDDPAFAARPYQGLTRVQAAAVARRETRTLPAGTLWIPADQPDFEVAVQLLEPEAEDSLLRWGLLSTVFERKEYIGAFVLEDFAAAALADPDVARQWQEALGDEAFASDPRARYLWWYHRTPSWEVQEQGLLPVLRVPGAMPAPTAPWR